MLETSDSSGGVSPVLAANRGLQPARRVGGVNATVGRSAMLRDPALKDGVSWESLRQGLARAATRATSRLQAYP